MSGCRVVVAGRELAPLAQLCHPRPLAQSGLRFAACWWNDAKECLPALARPLELSSPLCRLAPSTRSDFATCHCEASVHASKIPKSSYTQMVGRRRKTERVDSRDGRYQRALNESSSLEGSRAMGTTSLERFMTERVCSSLRPAGGAASTHFETSPRPLFRLFASLSSAELGTIQPLHALAGGNDSTAAIGYTG